MPGLLMNWNGNITRVDSNVYCIKFSKFYTKLSLLFSIPFHVFMYHITVVRLYWSGSIFPFLRYLWISVTHTQTNPLLGDWWVFETPTCLMQCRTPGFPLGARAHVPLQLPAPDTATASHKVHWAYLFALRWRDSKFLKMPYSLYWWFGNSLDQGWVTHSFFWHRVFSKLTACSGSSQSSQGVVKRSVNIFIRQFHLSFGRFLAIVWRVSWASCATQPASISCLSPAIPQTHYLPLMSTMYIIAWASLH